MHLALQDGVFSGEEAPIVYRHAQLDHPFLTRIRGRDSLVLGEDLF